MRPTNIVLGTYHGEKQTESTYKLHLKVNLNSNELRMRVELLEQLFIFTRKVQSVYIRFAFHMFITIMEPIHLFFFYFRICITMITVVYIS